MAEKEQPSVMDFSAVDVGQRNSREEYIWQRKSRCSLSGIRDI